MCQSCETRRYQCITTRRFGVEVLNGVGSSYNVFMSGLTRIGAKRVATNLTRHSAQCIARINATDNVVNGIYPPAKATQYRAAEYIAETHSWEALV